MNDSKRKTDVTVSDYIEYLKKQNTKDLFRDDFFNRLVLVSKEYGNLHTDETILETRLDVQDKKTDYSIKIYTGDSKVSEKWYELDDDAVTKEGITPCMFMDASYLKPGMGEENALNFIETEVAEFAGAERVAELKQELLNVVRNLNGKCSNLYQLGKMTSRGETSSMRVFTSTMSIENIVAFLEEVDWRGDKAKLKAFLESIEGYERLPGMILDFDILQSGISSKIGINFDLKSYKKTRLEKWLEFLVENNLCLKSKADGILKWTYTSPQYEPFIINDWSHFKFTYEDGIKAVKVYLRQQSKASRTYDSYFRPVVMNLELTDRCPLHCPQCYCDLNHGRDMDINTALYWIREAGKEKVSLINLSGGETILYDGLVELIRECLKYKIRVNVAFSGWGLTEERLLEIIEAGVSGIFISLNGSTEEINSLTRDGYEYAVEALECLKKIGYKHTVVNWVMHNNNAADFENMIALCEKSEVSEIAVMVFKPNAAHELPSEPDGDQIKKIAEIIKNYKGPVIINPENCFSQLKAVLKQKFLMNHNVGVEKGCGAGRDGISVSIDGKLTPCRHLDFYEEYMSIAEYWENSEIIKQLRQMQDRKDENCGACRYRDNCLPCAAVNVKLNGYIGMGHASCTLGRGQTYG